MDGAIIRLLKSDTGRNWLYHQVISAVFAAAVASALMSEPVHGLLERWLSLDAPPDVRGYLMRRMVTDAVLPIYLAFFAALYAWFWPINRFLADEKPDLREAARARFDRTYAFLAGLWTARFAAETALECWALHAAAPGLALKVYLGKSVLPNLFSSYYCAYLTVLYLEPLFFMKVARRFYPGEALYERKAGLGLGMRLKLLLFVLNLVLIPLMILGAALVQPDPGASRRDCLYLIFITFGCALGYCEMLYRGITQPIAGLIKKMELVRKGDYTVRTSVLSGDEIGSMKAHFNEMVEGLAERERLRDTFGRYVSVEVAKQLLKSGKVSLGGESIEATILFSDIRDFTPMSETMTPQELVEFLNSYFSHVTEPIAAHRGVVNKFIGDAVMAIFAPQFGCEDHAGDAVKAALAMREKLALFNAGRASPVRFGVGLHTGPLVAGNIGTEKRLEYTVIGDTVNVASRIESENKAQGSTVLLSEAVYRALDGDFQKTLAAERVENVRVKGKDRPLVLYKI